MKKKLLILGSTGMVGSSVTRLAKNNFNVLTPSRKKLNLFDKNKVDNFFKKEKPFYVINCAAKAGGIYANYIYPADFIYENLLIQNNIIFASHKYKVKRLMYKEFLNNKEVGKKFSIKKKINKIITDLVRT
jgi:GDP-L-fucose synthase